MTHSCAFRIGSHFIGRQLSGCRMATGAWDRPPVPPMPHFGGKDSILLAPPGAKTITNRRLGKPGNARPFCHGVRFTVRRNDSVCSGVVGLLQDGRPPAVFRTITEIRVHPVQSSSVRAISHVAKKPAEVFPLIADIYPPSAVVLKLHVGRVSAPVPHGLPRSVSFGFRHSMQQPSGLAPPGASAAFCSAGSQIAGKHVNGFSAIAQAAYQEAPLGFSYGALGHQFPISFGYLFHLTRTINNNTCKSTTHKRPQQHGRDSVKGILAACQSQEAGRGGQLNTALASSAPLRYVTAPEGRHLSRDFFNG